MLGAALIFLGAGFVQGLTGFGSALVAMPLLAFLMNVKTAVPLCMLNGLVITGYLSWRLRSHMQSRRIVPLIIGSLPGVATGALLLVRVDADIIRRLIAALLIFYSIYSLLIRPRALDPGPAWAYVAGFLTGAIGAALSAGGPPAIIYTSLTSWSKEEIKATLTGFFVVNGVVTAVVHAVGGLTTAEVLGYFWVTAPAVFCGTVLGSLTTGFISRELYIRLILGFLLLMGVMML